MATSPTRIFLLQCVLLILGEGACPAHAIFIRGFPPIGRYTQASLAYAISRIIMTVTTAYGCVVMGEYFGFIGITALLILFIGIYLLSVFMFIPEEPQTKKIPHKVNFPHQDSLQVIKDKAKNYL